MDEDLSIKHLPHKKGRNRRIGTSLVLIVLVAGCKTTESEIQPVIGSWGGAHVGLVLDTAGGRLEFDCASGTIDQPVIVNALGEFHEKGTHMPGAGGPVQRGEAPPAFPALYHGSVQGDRMTLRVIVPSNGTVIGPLSLVLGAAPVLTPCL